MTIEESRVAELEKKLAERTAQLGSADRRTFPDQQCAGKPGKAG